MQEKSSKPEELVRHFNISPAWAGHEWRQQGPYLVCQSCELNHSVYIGMKKMLTGFSDEGKPQFVRR